MSNELHNLIPSFPEQLRAFIGAKKLTQSAFQKRYGISESSLKRLLNGQLDRTRSSTLAKIAKIMRDKKWPAFTRASAPAVETSGIPGVDIVANVPEKTPSVDFTTFLSNADYKPRNLILFVTGYPDGMPQLHRDAWKALIEMHVPQFTGLVSGHGVAYDLANERFTDMPVEMDMRMTVHEKLGKPFRRLLDSYYLHYVRGRSISDVVNNGLRILAVEPDLTGTMVLDAWAIDGVVFGQTGCVDAQRDITAESFTAAPYSIRVYGCVDQGASIHEEAEALIKELNSQAQ